MSGHEYSIELPRLLSRRQAADGAPVPAFSFAVPEIRKTQTVPALKVNYGPEEDGDEVVLRSWKGHLYVSWDGMDYWSHGPRAAGPRAVTPERLPDLLGESGPLANLLSPEKPQHRLRRGPIPGADPAAEVRRNAEALVFVDGRLHRRVEEPTWFITMQGWEARFMRAQIGSHGAATRHPVWEVRFDRTDVAERLVAVRAAHHRDCRIAAPLGSVELLDPAYEPSFDVEVSIARVYGDDYLRKIEPALPGLDRGCVEAFAEMAEGFGALEAEGTEAARRFCDGLAAFCTRLAADRARIPPDLRNWVRERWPAMLERIAVAREMERGGPAPSPG